MRILVSLFLMSFLIACGSDSVDSCESVDFGVKFKAELDKAIEASQAYGMDPTNSQKCQAFKAAYEDYIDAVEDFEDCARRAGQLSEWRAAIDSARASINGISC